MFPYFFYRNQRENMHGRYLYSNQQWNCPSNFQERLLYLQVPSTTSNIQGRFKYLCRWYSRWVLTSVGQWTKNYKCRETNEATNGIKSANRVVILMKRNRSWGAIWRSPRRMLTISVKFFIITSYANEDNDDQL